MTTIAKKAPVLVTGGSGYIAGWIIKYLLEEGHTVHATVRDPAKKSSVTHLEAIAKSAPGTLKLYKADLLDQGSFDAAMQGCQLVMHTASPFVLDGYSDAHEALVRPAVEGTRNVLESVERTASVKRVVLTSSIASVLGDNADSTAAPGGIFTEAQWNTTSSVDHNPYQYSKVAAEREAWRLCEAQGKKPRWDLVTINPVMVFGPSLTKGSASGSIDTLLKMGRGKFRTGVPDLHYGYVDVREVARAHLLAGFTPDAAGRHILSAAVLSMLDMANILREKFGSAYHFPSIVLPKALVWLAGPFNGVTRKFVARNVGIPLRIDNRKSREALGVQYRPVTDTLTEHFQQALDDGLIRKRG